jgi:hypothetical protein
MSTFHTTPSDPTGRQPASRQELQFASIIEWQRKTHCEGAPPAGTSFPDLEDQVGRASGWQEYCPALQSLMGADHDWPSGTSFAELDAA